MREEQKERTNSKRTQKENKRVKKKESWNNIKRTRWERKVVNFSFFQIYCFRYFSLSSIDLPKRWKKEKEKEKRTQRK